MGSRPSPQGAPAEVAHVKGACAEVALAVVACAQVAPAEVLFECRQLIKVTAKMLAGTLTACLTV